MAQNVIRLFVQSRRVPVAVRELSMPVPNPAGLVLTLPRRGVVYDYVLDRAQQGLLNEVEQLARNTNTKVMVTDVGKMNAVSRLLRRTLLERLLRPTAQSKTHVEL